MKLPLIVAVLSAFRGRGAFGFRAEPSAVDPGPADGRPLGRVGRRIQASRKTHGFKGEGKGERQ